MSSSILAGVAPNQKAHHSPPNRGLLPGQHEFWPHTLEASRHPYMRSVVYLQARGKTSAVKIIIMTTIQSTCHMLGTMPHMHCCHLPRDLGKGNVFPFSDEDQWGRRLGKHPAGNRNGGRMRRLNPKSILLSGGVIVFISHSLSFLVRKPVHNGKETGKKCVCELGQTAKVDPCSEAEKLTGKVSSGCFLSG